MIDPALLQAEWARLLIESFADAGVRDVVLSPGSRSTPLVLAAHRSERLRCHDLVDERSAAFFALAQGKVQGRPSLLICTSGSAGANYLPAVVEADASRSPLIVLTADRPVELIACGANQTIDQLKLYGGFVRRFFDLGAADGASEALAGLRRTAAQAVFATRHPEPGPVHLNARLRKPLEPSEARSDDDRALLERVDHQLRRPIPRPAAPRLAPEEGAIAELAEAAAAVERGLVVCGPGPIAQRRELAAVAELAARTGFPLLADVASQWRFRGELEVPGALFVDASEPILRAVVEPAIDERFRPELVIQLGAAPTSSAWERFLARHPETPRWVLAAHGWNDPQSSAERLVLAEVGLAVEALCEELEALGCGLGGAETPWWREWAGAERLARRLISEELEADALSEAAVAWETVKALPAGGLLAVGNSLPIREVDAYCSGREIELEVWSQRGASGIDGLLSGAAGAAIAAGRPAALLVGDVSFLHDLSGVAALARVETPLAVVVVQNRGGRIFEQLPLAAHPAGVGAAFEHWTTPHELSLEPAAEMHSLDYARVADRPSLCRALGGAMEGAGATVLEAVVPPHGAAEQSRRLWRRLAAALADAA